MTTNKRSNSAPATERSTTRAIRTFLADDNPFMLARLAQSLSIDQRVTIVGSATDGHKAFQSAIMSQPDLVLIDLHMPGLNAADVIRWLRQTPNPPVIFVVTSDIGPESRARSLDAGADAFLVKDQDLPDRLRTAIQEFFGNPAEEENRQAHAEAPRGPARSVLPTFLVIGACCAGSGNPLPADGASPATQSFSTSTNAAQISELRIQAPPVTVWKKGVGEGFRSDAESFTVSLGANYGVACFGGQQQHHLALASVAYGHMLGDVVGGDHWYRGNFESRIELFGGMQFHPAVDTDGWLVGLSPHLRYYFATGTRWVPFADIGAGVTATGIEPPDLSGTFEFNLQAGGGVLYFLRNNLAVSMEAHYLHISCGGLHDPNLGLNGVTGMLGLEFFF